MSKDGRSEKATPKRKREAREEGNILKSTEVTTFMSLLAFSILLLWLGGWFANQVGEFQKTAFLMIKQETAVITYFTQLMIMVLKIMMIVVLLGSVFIILNYVIQVKYLFSFKVIKPQLKHINPTKYFKNLFSLKSSFDIAKSLVIVCILGFVVYFVFHKEMATISKSVLLPWQDSLVLLWGVFKDILIRILLAYMVIAAIDYSYQKWDYEKNLMMKKHEVKDERKQQDGSPEIKQKQRTLMREMLKKDTMQKTPKADVIVTNPTHYAIALKYNRDEDPVPKVIVKRVDQLALLMKEIGRDNDIPIYEDPALARQLYNKVEEEEYIPEELYTSVVVVIRFLIKKGKLKL